MLVRAIAWVLAAIFPSADGIPGLDRVDATPLLRDFFAEATPTMKVATVGCAFVFVASPLLTIGWPLPAFMLPRARLDSHAYRLAGSRVYLLRQAMLMLKTVGGLAWGAHPDVRAALQVAPYASDPGTFRSGGEAAADLRFAGMRQGRADRPGAGETLR